jgi:Uma2 family endonuclease
MTRAERIQEFEEAPVRFTAEEFMELAQHPPVCDWVGKVELIEGEIVRMSPAGMPHWNAQRLTTMHLQAAFAPLGPEWVVGAEAAIKLGKLTVRVPDVAVLRNPDLTAVAADRSTLFMAVEIADSSLRNDLGRKLRAYAAAGVPHYWVADLNGRRFHVMSEPADGDYREKSVVAFGEPIAVPGTDATITLA